FCFASSFYGAASSRMVVGAPVSVEEVSYKLNGSYLGIFRSRYRANKAIAVGLRMNFFSGWRLVRHQVAFSLGCLPLNVGVVGFGGVLVWHLKPIFFRILATVPALLSSSGLRWICVQSCEADSSNWCELGVVALIVVVSLSFGTAVLLQRMCTRLVLLVCMSYGLNGCNGPGRVSWGQKSSASSARQHRHLQILLVLVVLCVLRFRGHLSFQLVVATCRSLRSCLVIWVLLGLHLLEDGGPETVDTFRWCNYPRVLFYLSLLTLMDSRVFHKVLAVVLQATAAVLCLIARFFLTSLFKFFRFLVFDMNRALSPPSPSQVPVHISRPFLLFKPN
ncbi:hypothetical protein F2Q69_00050214, partial [Brassica cretica]